MMAEGSSNVHRVRCPACGKQALYSVENPSRPFCSPRCRAADLGAWASESYRVATTDTPSDIDEDKPVSGPAH
jgi:uncharacterized protein